MALHPAPHPTKTLPRPQLHTYTFTHSPRAPYATAPERKDSPNPAVVVDGGGADDADEVADEEDDEEA